MSKKKPSIIYAVTCADDAVVHVLARSPKGAVSVAMSHGQQPARSSARQWLVDRVDDDLAHLCINRKQG